jgi:hypothetical protein
MKKLLIRFVNKHMTRFGYQVINKHALLREDKYLDSKEFRYILWLDRIYEKIQNVPGHIVELGVAKGRNSLIFSNLIELNGDSEVRKYYGFDTFSGYTDEDLTESPHLNSNNWKDSSYEYVNERIRIAGYADICKLIPGDLKQTLPAFIESGMPGFNPGHLRVALLYVDCNAYLPAITGMEVLRQYMSPDGVICIDEKLQGGESKALIDFCKKYGYKFMKDSSSFAIPAYTRIK